MKKIFAVASIGVLLGAYTPSWAGGDADDTFKDTLRAMQERIKQLEDEVQRLKSAPPPPAATPVAAAPEGLENRLQKLEDGIGLLNGIKLGGMVYGSYNYNFNNPDSKDNSLRIFDTRANNFTLDLAQFSLSKEEEGGVGFKILLDYGRTAKLITSDWNGDGSLSNSTDNFEVQEAYATYTAGIGNGLGIKAGKFVTLLGAEVIEAPLNYNISRSFLFGYAIPFTHTGVLFTYPFMEQVSLSAGIVNGWDNVIDSNKGKSFLGNLTLKPADILTLSLNGVYGAELPDQGGSKRGVFDLVGTLNVTDHITFVTNFDYGTESRTGLNGKDADWYGVAGYLNIDGAQFNPAWEAFSIAQRLEWFDDEDGVRTGTKQDLWEATTTVKYKITDSLHFRAEYRHDDSDKRVFAQRRFSVGDETFTRFLSGQDTVAAELAYLFY
ncbi:MAG: porin [Candidatus Binatia bacterium]